MKRELISKPTHKSLQRVTCRQGAPRQRAAERALPGDGGKSGPASTNVRRVLKWIYIFALLLILAPSLSAREWGPDRDYEQPLQRAFMTELVYPQAQGEMQLHGLYGYSDGSAMDLHRFLTSFRLGLTDNWLIGVDWNAFLIRSPVAGGRTWGPGDLQAGTKYTFMNMGGSDSHLAFGVDFEFPVADLEAGHSDGFIEYDPYFALAFDFPSLRTAQLFFQGSVRFLQRVRYHLLAADDEPAAHQIRWGGGFFLPVGKFRVTSEVNWLYDKWNHSGVNNAIFLTPGLVWDLPYDWEIGVGVPVGLTASADNFRVLFSLTYPFHLFSRR